MKIYIVIFALTLAGCTDAEWDKNIGSLGKSGHILCYSGGQKIFEDDSTGQIGEMEHGAGWAFRDSKGKIIKLFADCIVTYK